jgi:hypothetical protein
MEATVVAILIPYLVRAGQRAAGQVADQLGDAAARLAEALWNRLGPIIRERPTAIEALEDAVARPDDQRARGSLELQLEKLVQADPGLRRDLEALYARGQQAGVIRADGSVVVQRMTGGRIISQPTHAQDRSIALGPGATARDITNNSFDLTGWDRLRRARGPGKWMMIAGLAIALAGFGVAALSMLSGSPSTSAAGECSRFSNPQRYNRCMFEQTASRVSMSFPPGVQAGFGAMVVGIVLSGAGSLVVLSSKERRDEMSIA